MVEIFEHHELDEGTYHAHPALSQSIAKRMLDPGGPAKVRWMLDNGRPSKREYDVGHAAHKLVLGVGEQIVDVGETLRTKKAQKAEADARATGKIPLRSSDVRLAEDMADALSHHTRAVELLSNGRPELSLFGNDPVTGEPIRGRIDWAREDGVLIDYKTSRDADEDHFASAAYRFAYHMQASWYLDLGRQCGIPAYRFVHIVQEKTAPYLVHVVELDPTFLMLGREANREAIDLWHECRERGVWPGYSDEITSIAPPVWSVDDDIEFGD